MIMSRTSAVAPRYVSFPTTPATHREGALTSHSTHLIIPTYRSYPYISLESLVHGAISALDNTGGRWWTKGSPERPPPFIRYHSLERGRSLSSPEYTGFLFLL